MNCGVCRYPNESRIEYFQTPLFVRQEFHRNEHRPNTPEDYGMMSERFQDFNNFGDFIFHQFNIDMKRSWDLQAIELLREMVFDQFDPAI